MSPHVVKQRVLLDQMFVLCERVGPLCNEGRGALVDARFVRTYMLSLGGIEMGQLVCSLHAGYIWAYLVIQRMQHLMVC